MIEKRFCIYSEAYGTSREMCGCVECSRILAEHVKQATETTEYRCHETGGTRMVTGPAAPRQVVDANEEQRRSFAFGNCNIDNPNVTRALVDEEAEKGQATERWLEWATEFQSCITAHATADFGKVWWASVNFPKFLADAVRTEAARARGLHDTGER